MEDYEIWGYAVSKMREKRGITQGKLAEQLGYSSSHFRRFEKGQIPVLPDDDQYRRNSSHGYVGNH